MIYLIEYDRRKEQLITFRAFSDESRLTAENARIELEVVLNKSGVDHEVVLLEASSEEDLRRTHSRYFEDLRTMVASHFA